MIIGLLLVRHLRRKQFESFKRRRERLMVVFGSGGHTTEMLYALHSFEFRQMSQVVFALADSDKTTVGKAQDYFAKNGVRVR